ncbi:MAG: 50S ribosomal protein L4 [Flavobacteriaceae bacterium]|nr:50S ribosomal protein L4 [Flavobacteriaceae bacterium]|tara:strand:+ start:926 stop:1552 length:627 start_codon:yes stop_codon:yes gene_type:complete
MKVSVLNIKGKDTGRSVDLSKSIFEIESNDHAVYLDVKRYLANQRQGTNKTKERAEITGSTRKIKKQKGTGTARAGSIKNPIFRGGGNTFGPRVRSYSQKLNKNVKKLARRSALSLKLKSNSVSVIEDFNFKNPKTKSFSNVINALGIKDKKSLFILGEVNKNVYLSARNLEQTNVVTNSEISTYSIMNAQHIVFFESSLEKIESNLS